ncbi:MAG: ATP-binding protein [Herbaspirillum sp.]
MTHFSIRRRLSWLVLGSLVLVWIAMLGISYDKAHEEIHELADAHLQQAARTLLMLDLKRLSRLTKVEEQEMENPKQDEASPLVFQIWSDDGELLLHSKGAPITAFHIQHGFATQTVRNEIWRSYTVHDDKRRYQIKTLEPLRARDHLIRKLAIRMGQVLLFALPLLALLIWISISLSLRPLARLSEAVTTRNPNQLESIQLQQVPTEVQALITALNRLLKQLAHSLDKERAFTADAAHELRTPLAAIKVQAQVALEAQDDTSRRHAITQVIAGVNRTTHLAQQLLLLARLEHIKPDEQQTVDLAELAAECIAQRANEATRKNIEFDFETEPNCTLVGSPEMLRVMLDNLLDNAIKYGRTNGQIAVTLQRTGSQLMLIVADDGEGVSSADRMRLQDRFFRVPGSDVSGSGLGLSIVEKIAIAHHGTLEIGTGLQQRGLSATISFTL